MRCVYTVTKEKRLPIWTHLNREDVNNGNRKFVYFFAFQLYCIYPPSAMPSILFACCGVLLRIARADGIQLCGIV